MSDPEFEVMRRKYNWRPIHGCPGRWVFTEGVVPLTIRQLVGWDCEIFEEQLPGAEDEVSWCYFSGGGMISYKKDNGYLHTLNDTEGMNRKMTRLKGIEDES